MSRQIKAKAKALENKLKDPLHYVKLGAKGGAGSRGYEFAFGKVDPKEVGRKGAEKRWGKR
jgi:general stress protein YciG